MQEFNYHSHTYRCMHADLDMKDEDYIQEYIKMGFKSIAFTDHCPEKNVIDKRSKIRMPYSEKDEYIASIQKLKERYAGKIQIQSGYEIEYWPGEEDNLFELKEASDKIIIGQHFTKGDDNELKIVNSKNELSDSELLRYAEYIEKAIELGIPDIIAHPDLFMKNRNVFSKIEEEVTNRICKVAEKYQIPLEINLNNIFSKTYYEGKILNNLPIEKQKEKLANVSYPNKEFWKIASKYNVKVLYGIDAHHRSQILCWDNLIKLAKEIIGNQIIDKLNFIEEPF